VRRCAWTLRDFYLSFQVSHLLKYTLYNFAAMADLRRESAGHIEITDEHGRRRTVQLEEMTDADRGKQSFVQLCDTRF